MNNFGGGVNIASLKMEAQLQMSARIDLKRVDATNTIRFNLARGR